MLGLRSVGLRLYLEPLPYGKFCNHLSVVGLDLCNPLSVVGLDLYNLLSAVGIYLCSRLSLLVSLPLTFRFPIYLLARVLDPGNKSGPDEEDSNDDGWQFPIS